MAGGLTGALLTLLAVAGVAAAFVGAGPARADVALLGQSIQARSPTRTALAVTVTELGSTAVMAVLAAAVGLWLGWRGRTADAVYVVATMAGAAGLFTVVKRVLDRPRPPEVDRLVAVSNESLPSGHATMAVVVLGSLVALTWPRRRPRTRLVLVLAATAWVGAVGCTRIYLGVHWFSDVLAGWLVGAAWLAVCTTVWSWQRARAAGRGGPSGLLA